MLKHIGQKNDNGLLGLSFWTFIWKRSILLSFRSENNISTFPPKCSRQNVPAKMFFWKFLAKCFWNFPAKCFFEIFPAKSEARLRAPAKSEARLNGFFKNGGCQLPTRRFLSIDFCFLNACWKPSPTRFRMQHHRKVRRWQGWGILNEIFIDWQLVVCWSSVILCHSMIVT